MQPRKSIARQCCSVEKKPVIQGHREQENYRSKKECCWTMPRGVGMLETPAAVHSNGECGSCTGLTAGQYGEEVCVYVAGFRLLCPYFLVFLLPLLPLSRNIFR